MSDITTPPDKADHRGRAWRCNLPSLRAAGQPMSEAVLALWIVEARWAHPLWHSFSVSLIHLRPFPGGTDAHVYRPGATHEFMLYALDPSQPREPQLRNAAPSWLHPCNFAAQLVETSDAAALSKIEATIDLVLRGELNPDTDARRQWIALFGDAMIKPEYRQ